jgi:hypothetical protein
MAIKSRVIADDGLTRVEEIDLLALTLDELKTVIPDGAGGFEWTVREVEAHWRAWLPSAGVAVKPLSRAAYARDIIAHIERLRSAIARDPSLEAWVLAAMDVGKMTEDAKWRFNRGDHVRQRVKIIATNRASSRKPRPRGNSASDQEIEETARRLRRTTPYARNSEQSTRWLAGKIAKALRIPFGTVRRRLTHLEIP